MAAALSPDAVFHSPVADYHGRDHIVPVLSALKQVITRLTPTAALGGPGQYVAFFTATIEGHEGDGVMRAAAEPDAPVTELSLMIRPLAALLAGVEQMKEVLGATSRSR